jgi:hypothetical protein
MAKHQAVILASFIHSIRRDWDEAGIVKALGDARLMGDAFDLALAAVVAAREPRNRTPAVIAMQGPHWAHAAVRHKSSANTTPPRSATCGICYMREDACRARWAGDHEFESIAQAKARAIRRADGPPPPRRKPERLRGRAVTDVELP